MVPAVPADVVDTAGAGDAFAAAMLDRLVDEVRGTRDELRISPVALLVTSGPTYRRVLAPPLSKGFVFGECWPHRTPGLGADGLSSIVAYFAASEEQVNVERPQRSEDVRR
jgi:hypothetical protein